MTVPKFLILTLLVLISNLVSAQKKIITGKVVDASTGAAIEGASIRLPGKTGGVITSVDGSFSIEAEGNDKLQISSVGYSELVFSINNQSNLIISLQPFTSSLGEIVLVGTRSAGRIKTETPVPIDVIRINQVGEVTARMDLTSVLNYSAPSFNYNKQSGADGADRIDLGTLRGLGPDQ